MVSIPKPRRKSRGCVRFRANSTKIQKNFRYVKDLKMRFPVLIVQKQYNGKISNSSINKLVNLRYKRFIDIPHKLFILCFGNCRKK